MNNPHVQRGRHSGDGDRTNDDVPNPLRCHTDRRYRLRGSSDILLE